MKSHITPNLKRQLPGQSPEEGTGASTPEARRSVAPSLSEDSSKTISPPIPPRLRADRREVLKEVVFNDWEDKEPRPDIPALLIVTAKFPSKANEVRQDKYLHGAIIRPKRLGIQESEDSEGGHWKPKSKRHRTRMPSHVKTYDESGDPKDHIKLFQSAAKTERWEKPTWCHMFNSTLTGNA
ncbi:hypothetical protein Tco_1084133, partial [Tanacetum coccineum]